LAWTSPTEVSTPASASSPAARNQTRLPRPPSLSSSVAAALLPIPNLMRQNPQSPQLHMLLLVVLLFAIATISAWALPVLAGWVITGEFPHLGFWHGMGGLFRLLFHQHPFDSAYPRSLWLALQQRGLFWTAIAAGAALEGSALTALFVHLDQVTSRPTADRRIWQLRGLHPRPYARPHMVRPLLVDKPDPERIIVGNYNNALLSIQKDVQTLVIAPPRSGKTSGLVIPAALEHEGPLVTTSVRSDVRDQTIARRQQLGHVFGWDPFGTHTDSWNPIQGCKNWGHSLQVARWLTQAVDLGSGGNTEYFAQEAQGMIGPLLHAAALSGRTVIDVYNWILEREESEPEAILIANNAYDANRRLENVYSYTERQRDGIIGMAASYLQMYAHPSAQRASHANGRITPEALFAPGECNTLYVVAGREYQKLLAPLVVTLLSSMLHYLSEQENTGFPQKPPALFALDETANIAPLSNLPQILSTSLPSARFITVWHSVAQMHATYKEDVANALLGLSLAKVFLGSITDQYTIRELTGMLGEETTNRPDMSPRSITAQAMQRARAGQGLLIHTDFAPIFYKQRRYYTDAGLQQLSNPPKRQSTGPPMSQVMHRDASKRQRS
jgi:type IV secretion system protein VirD4